LFRPKAGRKMFFDSGGAGAKGGGGKRGRPINRLQRQVTKNARKATTNNSKNRGEKKSAAHKVNEGA